MHEKKGVTHAFSNSQRQFHLVINQSGCEPKKFGKNYVVSKIFVLNLPDGQVLFFWGTSNYRRIVINPANQKVFWG